VKRIGMLTIGQSPRTDVLPDMLEFLHGAEILQAGALDGLTAPEMAALAPQGGSDVLVSRLQDGTWVLMEENKVLPLLQQRVDSLCAQGVELLIMLCTGKFPDVLRAQVPILYPQKLLYGVVPLLAQGRRVGVLNPDPKQLEQCRRNWAGAVGEVAAAALNPYEPADGIPRAARELTEGGAQLIVMDCMGYTRAMKAQVARLTGKSVILPRTLLARTVGELLSEN
jgi:protein AroM